MYTRIYKIAFPITVYKPDSNYISQCGSSGLLFNNQEIFAYLQKSKFVSITLDYEYCFLCGEKITHRETKISDGHWVWSANLMHHTEKHNFIWPLEFMEHVEKKRKTGYKPDSFHDSIFEHFSLGPAPIDAIEGDLKWW